MGSVFSTRKSAPASEPPSSELSIEAQLALEAFDRGLELIARKDHEHALEAWLEAAALDPGNKTYQANLKRLERMLMSAPY